MEDNIVQCFSEKSGVGCSDSIHRELNSQNNVRTVSEIIMSDKGPKATKLMSNLTNVIEVKNRRLEEMEKKYTDTRNTISKLIVENDKLQKSYYEEVKEMQFSIREHFQWICNDHDLVNLKLQRQEQELELRSTELQKREVVNQKKRKRLAKEVEQSAAKNSLLEEQRRANESMMKLADDHMREKEKLNEKIILLKKQLDAKHDLELQKNDLEAKLEVKKSIGDDDLQHLKEIEDLYTKINERNEELEYLESIGVALSVQERIAYEEVQDAREVLIEGFKELPKATPIGVKTMGKLESKPFYDAMKQMYDETEAEEKASELRAIWEENVRDPCWDPFKLIFIHEKLEEIIDETDEKLKSLKRDLGEKVYESVTTALTESYHYNPSGGYGRKDLWNFAEGKKATLKEGVSCLLEMWDTQKRKRVT